MLCASCAALNPKIALDIPDFDPPSHYIANAPFHAATGMRCGPAALTSVLNYYGVEAKLDDVAASVMESESIGSHVESMFAYAVASGLPATIYSGGTRDLKRQIAAGRPVIVLLDYGIVRPSGHFVLVVGYDENSYTLYDGEKINKKISSRALYSAWARMDFTTLLILPKGENPPLSSAEILAMALASEEAGNWVEAEKLYRLALERDELNIGAIIGVGNALYNRGEYEKAVNWQLLALRNDRKRADALVNLSKCYLALGKLDEAQRSARKAIKLRSKFDVYAYEALGDALAAKGDKKGALEAYATAIAIINTNTESQLLEQLKVKIDNSLK